MQISTKKITLDSWGKKT